MLSFNTVKEPICLSIRDASRGTICFFYIAAVTTFSSAYLCSDLRKETAGINDICGILSFNYKIIFLFTHATRVEISASLVTRNLCRDITQRLGGDITLSLDPKEMTQIGICNNFRNGASRETHRGTWLGM